MRKFYVCSGQTALAGPFDSEDEAAKSAPAVRRAACTLDPKFHVKSVGVVSVLSAGEREPLATVFQRSDAGYTICNGSIGVTFDLNGELMEVGELSDSPEV